jgi:hypothetical protein
VFFLDFYLYRTYQDLQGLRAVGLASGPVASDGRSDMRAFAQMMFLVCRLSATYSGSLTNVNQPID